MDYRLEMEHGEVGSLERKARAEMILVRLARYV